MTGEPNSRIRLTWADILFSHGKKVLHVSLGSLSLSFGYLGTPMGGSFKWDRFLFQVENGDDLIGLRATLDCDDFDARLISSGRVPDLNGAPIASWALARLRKMTDDGFPAEEKERNDGGGYLLHFVVYNDPEEPVASFQFQGTTEGIGIIGDRSADYCPEEIIHAIVAAILAEPNALMECRFTIVDPEWKFAPDMYTPTPIHGSRNRYGWDGTKFLGRKNIREK